MRHANDKNGVNILDKDYPQFVEEEKTLDQGLSSFEAYK